MVWQATAMNIQQKPLPLRPILAPFVEAITAGATRAIALPGIDTNTLGSARFYIGSTERCESKIEKDPKGLYPFGPFFN